MLYPPHSMRQTAIPSPFYGSDKGKGELIISVLPGEDLIQLKSNFPLTLRLSPLSCWWSFRFSSLTLFVHVDFTAKCKTCYSIFVMKVCLPHDKELCVGSLLVPKTCTMPKCQSAYPSQPHHAYTTTANSHSPLTGQTLRACKTNQSFLAVLLLTEVSEG